MIQCPVFRHLLLFCFLLLLPLPALAISTVSINSTGNGAFLFKGANLDNVTRIEVSISYNTSLLANPRVNPQSSFDGARVVVNNNGSGTVRLTVTSGKAMQGNGAFATIAFDSIGKTAGVINSLTGKIYGQNNLPLPVAFAVANPPTPLDPNNPDDASMLPGGKFYAPDGEYKGEERPEPDKALTESGETQAASRDSDAPPAAQTPSSAQPEKSTQRLTRQTQSVLERFRVFKGERSIKNFTALFTTDDLSLFKQDPPIFLADGKGTVKVTLAKISGAKSLNFAFNSARYVSHHRVSEDECLVEARPEQGVTSAGITILTDKLLWELPLTVSPKARVDLIRPGKVSEADFALFLKERGKAGAPRFDLNGDGKRDYLDDYIFTANYLVAQERRAGKKPAVRRTAEGKGEAKAGRLKQN
jgi:hypothetical protein